jgi:DNA-binding transcriptional ArsR family regulator
MSTLIQPDSDQMQLATVMAALSDPVRVTIVRALAAQGEFACGTLALSVSPATRSHHFRVLREAGITNTRVAGTHRFVSLRREALDERFPGLLDAVLTAAEREAAYTTPAS